MNIGRWTIKGLTIVAATTLAAVGASASTLDRNYSMGDDSGEGAANNGSVSVTFDSQGVPGQGQFIDLTGVNTPTYRTVSGRPDGGTGLGIEFSAANMEYLRGRPLGDPSVSISALPTGSLNYAGIVNRGLQFWVRPTSTAVQTLVMDTNQHGARIDASGKFSMRYAGADFATNVSAVANTWYHIMVVRPLGAGGGSRMYVNGVAEAAAPGGYNVDAADLVVGSNTGGDAMSFTGGNAEFFSGIIDDLELFVIGQTTTPPVPAVNYGQFNFETENDYANALLFHKAGDVNNNNMLDAGDKTAFISGWQTRKVINGIQIGDMGTRAAGDLNLDGINDINDLLLMQQALVAGGLPAITPAELAADGVPEPSTMWLLAIAALAPLARRRMRR